MEQHATDTLQPFLDRLREALTAVANGDPEPMKALCSHSDAISQCGFWGGVERGWAEVGERLDWVAAQFVPGPGDVTSDTAFLTVSGDMAYGVFIGNSVAKLVLCGGAKTTAKTTRKQKRNGIARSVKCAATVQQPGRTP
jgi:hypothetical protein